MLPIDCLMRGFPLWRASASRREANENEESSENEEVSEPPRGKRACVSRIEASEKKDDLIKELCTRLQAVENKKLALRGHVDALTSELRHLQQELEDRSKHIRYEAVVSSGMASDPSSPCSSGHAKKDDVETRATSWIAEVCLPIRVSPIAPRRPEGSRPTCLPKQRFVQTHRLRDGPTRDVASDLQKKEDGSASPPFRRHSTFVWGSARLAEDSSPIASLPFRRHSAFAEGPARLAERMVTSASRTATMASVVSFSSSANMQPGSTTVGSPVTKHSHGVATSDVCSSTGDRRRIEALLDVVANNDQLKHAQQQASSAVNADVSMLVDLAILEGIPVQQRCAGSQIMLVVRSLRCLGASPAGRLA